jgi:hypothetical protein
MSSQDVVGVSLRSLEVFNEVSSGTSSGTGLSSSSSSPSSGAEDRESFIPEITKLNHLSKGAHAMFSLQSKASVIGKEVIYAPVLCSLHAFPIVREVQVSASPPSFYKRYKLLKTGCIRSIYRYAYNLI